MNEVSIARLKSERLKKKKTQKDVADFLGLTKQAVQRYESGLSTPKLETWVKLADFFGVDVGYLQGLTNLKNRESAKENFLKTVTEDSNAFIERKYSVLDPFITMNAEKYDSTIKLLQEHFNIDNEDYDEVNILQKRRMAWIVESVMDTPTQIKNSSSTDDIDRFIDVMITAVNDWYEPNQPAKSDNVTNYKSRYLTESQNKKASDN